MSDVKIVLGIDGNSVVVDGKDISDALTGVSVLYEIAGPQVELRLRPHLPGGGGGSENTDG
jgi:hypothetical protein